MGSRASRRRLDRVNEMKSVFDAEVLQSMVERIERVTTASQARWGKMNAEKMLDHLVQSARMATGELSVAPKKMPIRYAPLRQLIVYWLTSGAMRNLDLRSSRERQ